MNCPILKKLERLKYKVKILKQEKESLLCKIRELMQELRKDKNGKS